MATIGGSTNEEGPRRNLLDSENGQTSVAPCSLLCHRKLYSVLNPDHFPNRLPESFFKLISKTHFYELQVQTPGWICLCAMFCISGDTSKRPAASSFPLSRLLKRKHSLTVTTRPHFENVTMLKMLQILRNLYMFCEKSRRSFSFPAII